jgi:type VI secretion system secreted protein Hcp
VGIGKRFGRPGKAAALVALGALGGGAALAIAAVPGNDGVIHACYEVQQNGTTPLTGGPNVRIIDPSAGQTCNAAVGVAAPLEHAVSWNVTGPAGAPGTTGPQGPPGPAGQTLTIAGQTFTLSNGKALTIGPSAVPSLQAKPNGRPVATMTLGSGRNATSFNVLAWQLVGTGAGTGTGAGRTNVSSIQIMKKTDKASVNLLKYCTTGKHIPRATITVRKAGAKAPYLKITLTNVLVSSYQLGSAGGGAAKPSESLSLNFTKIEYRYSTQ